MATVTPDIDVKHVITIQAQQAFKGKTLRRTRVEDGAWILQLTSMPWRSPEYDSYTCFDPKVPPTLIMFGQ
ncbi:hypothetical protein WJX81_000992 [Elliptochloris bilobata]|uniref:Uncharacterized protein n=1 Tax=Elliptochloris bilobata TaxID=381761 RepID=A0AAW1S4G3_9CHLO